jgi:hypothetical protein
MTVDLQPLEFRASVGDISRFQNFVRPRRQLTQRERGVYDELAVEWAVLDTRAQSTLYAMLLDGRLAEALVDLFTSTATKIYARLDSITDSRVSPLSTEAAKAVIQLHLGHLMGYYGTAGSQFAGQLSTDMTPPPVRGFWARVLEG